MPSGFFAALSMLTSNCSGTCNKQQWRHRGGDSRAEDMRESAEVGRAEGAKAYREAAETNGM